MFLHPPLHSEFGKEVINFKNLFDFNLDQLQYVLKWLVSTKWQYKEVWWGREEPLGCIVVIDQLQVIVKLHCEDHYVQRHPRELADMPMAVFSVKLNFPCFDHLEFWPVFPRVNNNMFECSCKTAHVLSRILVLITLPCVIAKIFESYWTFL